MSVTHRSCDLVYSLIILMPDAQRYKLQSGRMGQATRTVCGTAQCHATALHSHEVLPLYHGQRIDALNE